jgi:hypothetical protein
VVRLHPLDEAAHQAREHHAIAAGVGPLRVARVVVHNGVLHSDVTNHASQMVESALAFIEFLNLHMTSHFQQFELVMIDCL